MCLYWGQWENVRSHGDGDDGRARGLFNGGSAVVGSGDGRESSDDGEELHFDVV
jgi:hypothetical protein